MDEYNKNPNTGQDREIEPEDTYEPESTDSTEVQEESKPITNKRENISKKSRIGISALAGGLVGGIVSAIIVALLFTSNIIPINNNAENDAIETTASANFIQNLSNEDAHVSTNIEEVAEAVVGVVNMQQHSIWTGNQEAGTGSGIIYKKEDGKAYIVTNQHVVENAENVEIVLSNDERIPARVLGEDALTDLAVLEVDGDKINTVAKIGNSEDIVIGETVLAIGNPLGLEFANTVTKGIISGLNRSIEVDTNRDGQADWITEVIQTDAAINPGNSGGALINADGEVIGINSMKIAQSAVEGIGFAIPVDTALPIMEQLEIEGEITRPLIGISTAALYQVPPQYRYEINLPDDVKGGMVVANVEPGSPAEEAGLQQFDVITKINDEEVTSIIELRKHLYSEANVGEAIKIEFIRDGKVETTDIVLEQIEDAA
ncbi:S1C family serine protease [Oceanobacillus sp. CAU 1775]